MKFKFIILPTLILALLLAFFHIFLRDNVASSEEIMPLTLTKKIILVPLDSRPPCRKMPIDVGRVAGIDVVTPDSSLLDYYSLAGDTKKMREWLLQNSPSSNAIIISIDQLLYGGLLAARENTAAPEEINELLDFLQELHKKNPATPIYAFSILPRQIPQDTIDGYDERKALVAYSRLKGRESAGLAVDEKEIASLEKVIPPASLKKYLEHFKINRELNEKLIDLAKNGTITQLILGQDDGEPYSIPNIEKEKLIKYITEGNAQNNVILTHGADEIALSALAEFVTKDNNTKPKVYVKYNSEYTPSYIMPYMAIDTAATVQEKLALTGCEPVASESEADFILIVSANDSDYGLNSRSEMLSYIKSISQQKPVALVDLSKHFAARECVMPLLINDDFPLNSLIAYAGWNTTSNAVGTAVAAGSIYIASQQQAKSLYEAISITAANLKNLHNRILEDYFYLKEDIDTVNSALKKAGFINTADLDLLHNHRYAANLLHNSLDKHIALYKNSKAYRTPVKFTSAYGEFTLSTYDLTVDASFPWPRTFEIYLDSTPFFILKH